ncbi:MAG: hypothetical protein K2X91_08195, partial [Thermoleophilia bacterium]|nr:hypothetical protein [Thermoleophilia bacterium]
MTPPPDSPEPNRPELDPPSADGAPGGPAPAAPAVWPQTVTGTPPPPEDGRVKRADAPDILARIDGLIGEVAPGTPPDSMKGRLVKDLIVNALKLIPDNRDTGEIKLITAAVKELRYAYRVFGQYPEPHKVTIFGSARTPRTHPD